MIRVQYLIWLIIYVMTVNVFKKDVNAFSQTQSRHIVKIFNNVARCNRNDSLQNRQKYSWRLHLSFNDPEPDYGREETLLKIRLSVQPNTTCTEAFNAVTKYSQSFPFAAVLPVQPLFYLPTDDNGVDIKFLRKKTEEKSGNDGGIRFFVENVDDQAIEVTAKRNSLGQTIAKIFAEKLVVEAYVAGFTRGEHSYSQAPLHHVRVESVFHKWL